VGRRIRWLGVFMVLCFALVIVQLVNIQFRRASALANSPGNPRVVSQAFDNLRGTITAADGTVLAQSVPAPAHSTKEYMRTYPGGSLYGGITGFDDVYYGPLTGIEAQYNSFLDAHPRSPQNFSELLFDKPPPQPDNVQLTIDPVLQQAASQALTTLPPGPNKDGAVVVLDPSTGAVLAMVSNPTYDPNGLANPDVHVERANYYIDNTLDHEGFRLITPMPTQQRFPPGSTFKVVTSVAVYNLRPDLINFNFPVAPSIKFTDSQQTLSNDGGSPCGGTMVVMLPQSCDPGYAELGIAIGAPTLTQQAQLFGFSIYGAKQQSVPNLDLPGVVPSTFSDLPASANALLAYSAIGQDNDSATALQNALVASGVADGGIIMTPHLMEQIRDSQGNVVTTYQPKSMAVASSGSAAISVNTLMQGVAVNGTAAGIFPAPWHVAVKTGTAQVQAPNAAEQTDDWMIGFMPAVGTPKLAIAVVVPYQTQDLTGAVVAGPIVKAVFQAYLNETAAAG
jgi:peptidoglycan glycosyltransferase